MREIKFRAWTGENMISPDYINRDGFAYYKENSIPSKVNIIMQFTGLQDQNGVDIYENDIVIRNENACDGTYISKYKVGYEKNYFCLEILQSHIFKKGAIIKNMEQCEVIGNIYENPELLK